MPGQGPVGGGLVVALLALVAEVLVTVRQVVPQRGLARRLQSSSMLVRQK